MRKLATLSVLIGILAISPYTLACECGEYVNQYASMKERINDAVCLSAKVFLGRVESTMLNPDKNTYTVCLIAIKAWKGVHTDRAFVTAKVPRGGNCGFLFVTGRVYLVFDSGNAIGLCGGPKSREGALEELKILGEPEFINPDPDVVSFPEP